MRHHKSSIVYTLRIFGFPSPLLASFPSPFHFRYSYLRIKFQRDSLSRFGALACES